MLVLQGIQGVRVGLLHRYTLFQQFSRRSPLGVEALGPPHQEGGKTSGLGLAVRLIRFNGVYALSLGGQLNPAIVVEVQLDHQVIERNRDVLSCGNVQEL